MDVLREVLGGFLGGSEKRTDPENRLGDVAKVALPIILYGLYKNTQNAKEKESLERAVDNHRAGAKEGIETFMRSLAPGEDKKMVEHVFRGRKDQVRENIAREAGVSQEEVDAVLEKLTPQVMAMLAKEKEAGRSVEEVMREQVTRPKAEGGEELLSMAKDFFEAGGSRQSLEGVAKNLLKSFLK